MFSGFRSVVENLAQPQPHPTHSGRSESQDFSPERSEHQQHARAASASFDLSSVAQSTGHLAESAFSNLRKSLAAQRAFAATSPTPAAGGSRNMSPQPDRELRAVTKLTLEDRLRASFAIGEASGSTTPDHLSQAPSPRPALPPTPAPDRVMSPTSMPLPDSPVASPTPDIGLTSPSPLTLSTPPIVDDPPSEKSGANIELNESDRSTSISKERDIRIDISPVRIRYAEADIPLPLFSPGPTNLSASQSSHSAQSDIYPQVDGVVDGLRTTLSSLEKQFAGASTSLDELRTTQDAVNAVLLDLTPIAQVSDVKGLRDHLQNLNLQQNLSQDEIKRLNNKLRSYDDRIEELRDTHRLESRSQTELVDSLRKQLEEAEALLKAACSSTTQAEDESRKRQAELDQARTEAQKLRDNVKEEEEKRGKAISLLKTVRQKLVKAEKDRDDAAREASTLREKEKAEKEKETAEKAKLEKEIEDVRVEKERDISGLKVHFDRELAAMKDRFEKEFSVRKGQLEYEACLSKGKLLIYAGDGYKLTGIKAIHQKEVAVKNAKTQALENSVRSLNSERDSLFDQLQMRQAELESSQSMLESLQSGTSELQFQLRESTERSALLVEELADARRELEYRDLRPSVSADDSAHARAALEAKYETKIGELSARLNEIEKDRNETEIALSRNLQQKTQEIEMLRKLADNSAQSKGISEEEVLSLKQEIDGLQHQLATCKEQLSDLDRQKDRVNELEARLQKQFDDFSTRAEQYERDVAEAREREAQIRASNKTLREELRKVQSSAALLEKQRNPGVGYWSTMTRHDNSSEARLSSPTASTSDVASLSRIGSPTPTQNDEEINLEYLRNVILQFLEHKEMRPHLVRVLSIILHFTPQETRRLIAKV
ncbi:hypothetical protein DFH11DRAFT_1560033 [Phellopilus nigrolimitatus]|nr:hypothetical protein DFH11DRAFT_1560033 [Phellopilus nigrolimitatus]